MDGDLATVMWQETDAALQLFHDIPEEMHNYRYAPGKWSIKDILVHIIDTERVMSYRALAAARGDSHTVLGLMDENLYAAGVDNTGRPMEDIIEEFAAVRGATELMLMSFAKDKWLQASNVDGRMTTARAWAYIMLGHVRHHMNVVQERYL
ncbi:DinB family protein [Nemorincola caseinilytica]|uniref:DinB family protein n=1 Tax=Nemorincola caseinilytica TaxID=2054315 RepID=A0ABP8NE68_9BACT